MHYFDRCGNIQKLSGEFTSDRGFPGVAKFGIALEWGSRGPEFESQHSDQLVAATIACDEFFHFIVKLIVRSFCRSPLSQKVTLGSPARLQAPSQRLAVAANFLRDNALRAAFFRHRKNIDFDRPYANNDNPNYIIQVGNVFGFIISIENIF